MSKLYIVTYKNESELEDCIFTVNWEKALELLNKKPSQKQIIEYTFDSKGVSTFWNAFHYYVNGILTTESIQNSEPNRVPTTYAIATATPAKIAAPM